MSSMLMPQGPPPGMAALLGGGGPPGGGQPQGADNGLSTLQDVIHGVVALMHDLTDPGDKAVAAKVLQLLMPLQAKMMGGANGPAAQGG